MSLPAASPARACASLRAWNAQRYGWPSWRGMRQWRPSTNMNEHKEERSLERLVDMEVSREKIRFWDFWGSLAEARRSSEREDSTRAMIAVSIQILGVVQFPSTRLYVHVTVAKRGRG